MRGRAQEDPPKRTKLLLSLFPAESVLPLFRTLVFFCIIPAVRFLSPAERTARAGKKNDDASGLGPVERDPFAFERQAQRLGRTLFRDLRVVPLDAKVLHHVGD